MLNQVRQNGKKIVAVGTATVKVLETILSENQYLFLQVVKQIYLFTRI